MSTTNFSPDPYRDPSNATGSAPYEPVSGGSMPPPPPPPGYPEGYPPVPPQMPASGLPNPMLAGLLGFIPGVGAMYNGQFAKGLAHIAVFAVLSSLADHVNGVFGIFVAGWVFYMVFEAYQTARARREGLPLPDPFGFNHIGERFGFGSPNPDLHHFWGQTMGRMPGAAPYEETARVDTATGAVHYTRTDASGRSTYQVDPAGNVFTSNESTAPAGETYVPPAGVPTGYQQQAYGGWPPAGAAVPPYGAGPYGVTPGAPFAPPPVPPPPPFTPRNGLPAGAIWLIVLGFLALLTSLHPFQYLQGEATGGLLLIGLSFFVFYRRWSTYRGLYPPESPAGRWNVLRAGRGSFAIFVAGLLTLLQGLHIAAWESTWPIMLIALGLYILLERLAFNNMNAAVAYPGYPAPPAPPVTAEAPAPVVETASPTSIVPKYTRPSNDLGDEEGR